jgi:hypothetical protein
VAIGVEPQPNKEKNMNLIKIVAPVLGAIAILGTAVEGDAAQCRRFPAAGNNVYPTSGEIRLLNVGCQDGTRGNIIADASPKEFRVKLVNKTSVFATVRATGSAADNRFRCFAESRTVGLENKSPCSADTTIWSAELRND